MDELEKRVIEKVKAWIHSYQPKTGIVDGPWKTYINWNLNQDIGFGFFESLGIENDTPIMIRKRKRFNVQQSANKTTDKVMEVDEESQES